MAPIAAVLVLIALGVVWKNSGDSRSDRSGKVGDRSHLTSTSSNVASPRTTSAAPQYLIPDQLPPDLQIVEGTIDGAEIRGPVVISGVLPPSTMTSGSSGGGESFKIEAADQGQMQGAFYVEAASARATKGGVRFSGPIKFQYQGDVGQWYELTAPSEDAYFFVSQSGLRKHLGSPEAVQFGSVEIPSGQPGT